MTIVKINKPKEFNMTITLTEREARALMTILHKVGGRPEGPRGATDPIYQALHDAGIRPGRLKSGTHSSIIMVRTWEELGEDLAK